MIIKQIPKKSANSGSFKGLANYILDRNNIGDKILNNYINTTNLLKDPKSSLEDIPMMLWSMRYMVSNASAIFLVIQEKKTVIYTL